MSTQISSKQAFLFPKLTVLDNLEDKLSSKSREL